MLIQQVREDFISNIHKWIRILPHFNCIISWKDKKRKYRIVHENLTFDRIIYNQMITEFNKNLIPNYNHSSLFICPFKISPPKIYLSTDEIILLPIFLIATFSFTSLLYNFFYSNYLLFLHYRLNFFTIPSWKFSYFLLMWEIPPSIKYLSF